MASAEIHAEGSRREFNTHRLRELLLSSDRPGRLSRELWSSNGFTYTAHRRYISAFRSTGRRIGAVSISAPSLTTSASHPATQGQTAVSGTLTQHSVSSGAELLKSTGSASTYQQFYSYTAAPSDGGQARHLPPSAPVFTPAPAASYSFEGA
ncbi:MAG: hypothetical protein WDW38_006120 [Sanguina aurantia]